MNAKKPINIKNLLTLCMSLFIQKCAAESQLLDQLAEQISQSQSGTDMQSTNNRMFYHSFDMYPQDDPTIRFVQAEALRYFQPADGSMKNGMYHKIERKAETFFNTYKDVVVIDGTKKQPRMNEQNQYTNEKGQHLDFIGIFDEHSDNDGEKKLCYLFGTIEKIKKVNNADNKPSVGYYTFPQQ